MKRNHLVITPHTAEQCLEALEHLADERHLASFEFGCKHGDHTGYAWVQASTPEEALALVPSGERSTARAIPLDQFTAEQLRAAHQR